MLNNYLNYLQEEKLSFLSSIVKWFEIKQPKHPTYKALLTGFYQKKAGGLTIRMNSGCF